MCEGEKLHKIIPTDNKDEREEQSATNAREEKTRFKPAPGEI